MCGMSASHEHKTAAKKIIDGSCHDEAYSDSGEVMDTRSAYQQCETYPLYECSCSANSNIFD